jgi:hypothetical protein
MQPLRTTSQVIDAIGGNLVVLDILRRAGDSHALTSQAISMWRAHDRMPPRTYLVLTRELQRSGHSALPKLWSMINPL